MIKSGYWWDKALMELTVYPLPKEQRLSIARHAPDDIVHLGRLFGKRIAEGPFQGKYIWKGYDKSVHLIWDLDNQGRATIIAAWKESIDFPWETA
jgi:hypothetical protein